MDINDDVLRGGLRGMDERLERFFVAKGKMTSAEKNTILSRISSYTKVNEAVRDADFVIEAVAENLALKKEVFEKLDLNTPSHAILASNTSYQNISEMASVTERPEKVLGMHFFNPVALMKLVEVVRAARTSEETLRIACGLVRKFEKEPVVCKDTSYGFLANRAYSAMSNEAVQMVWERVASPEEIDKALKLGYNLPMGPLELMDFTGAWSIRLTSEQDRMKELGPEKGRLHPLIRMMHRAKYGKIYDFWKDVLSKW
jgi:3-hydroxybutyryl-CoA dehydrogenase